MQEKKWLKAVPLELFDPANTVIELDTLDNDKVLLQIQQSVWASSLQPSRSGAIVLKMNRQQIPEFHQALAAMQVPVVIAAATAKFRRLFFTSNNRQTTCGSF